MNPLERIFYGLVDRYSGSNFLANESSEQDYQRTRELRQDDYDQQWKMFNAQNDYNSPSNQLARFRDAGLNPHLMYGAPPSPAANVGANASGSFSSPRGANGAGDLISSIQQASLMKKQKELIQAEIDNKNQDTFLKSGQYTESIANANLINKQSVLQDEKIKEITANIEVLHAKRNELNASANKITYETDIIINDMAFRNETFNDIVQTIKNQRTISDAQANNINRMIKTQLKQMDHYINYIDSLKDLNAEQKELVKSMKANYDEVVRITKKQADIIENMGNTEHVIQMISQLMSSSGMFLGGLANLVSSIMSKGTTPNIYLQSDGNVPQYTPSNTNVGW